MQRKSNKLYTVNKWNTPLFADIDKNQDRKNLFAFGDPALNISSTVPYINWGDSAQVNKAINNLNTSLNLPSVSAPSLGGFMAEAQNNPMGAFGLKSSSKFFSPGSIGGAAAGVAGSIVGGLAYNGLSEGLNSGAGSAVNSIGSTIGGAISTVNPLLGGIVSAGSGIVGGGINALIGTSVDQAKLNKANAGTDYYNNFDTNAGSFDDVQDIADMGSVGNAYKGGVFRKSWARRHNDELNRNRANAVSYAYRGRENNISNLYNDQINNSLANYASFGGYIGNDDTPAIDYDFADRYLNSKEKKMNTKTTDTTYPTINVFADGGIEIKHPGRLTALKKRTGKTEAELWAEGKPEVRKMITFARNARKWKKSLGGNINVLGGGGCLPPTMFAIGGDLQTHGADWDNGVSIIGAGGLHEENPNEGVQIGVDNQGVPNLVEEGEVIFNDYVYSNRIVADDDCIKAFHLPKKAQLTYAEVAKKLEKESSERPNDPISQAALKVQMQDLSEHQERQKAEMLAKEAEEAFNTLSDEEKVAVMQQAAMAEQEALNQQALQEQAMQEQAIAEQQQLPVDMPKETLSEEQAVLPEEQLPVEEANVNANGGPLGTANLYPGGGNVNPWAFDSTWEGFKYYNPQTKTYDQGYLDFVKNIEQSWVDDMLAGKYGSMDRYNARNKGYAPTVDQVQKWATDGRYSDWHKTMANAYTSYLNNQAGHTLPEAVVSAKTRPDYRDTVGEQILQNNMVNMGASPAVVSAPAAPAFPADNAALTSSASAAIAADPLLNPVSTEAAAVREAVAADLAKDDNERNIEPVLKKEWPRYAGIFGPSIGLGMQMLGIGKPKFGDIDAAIELAKREPTLANYERVNDYLRYRPLDTWFGQNNLIAQAESARRALTNSSSPSRAAGILASNLNTQIASGNLFRQAQEYNDAQREKVAQFNRGTNIQNANAYNQNQQFNASTMNQNRLSAAQMALHGAQAKSYARDNWYDSLYGNLAGIFKGIHDIGRENTQRNWLARLAASGAIRGITPENAPDLVKYAAKGGKIKKKKRGLTF